MICNREFHTHMCKYLWSRKWKSWYEEFCLRWSNRYVEEGRVFRTKPAYSLQQEIEDERRKRICKTEM
jgi:hypothetical protein